MAPKFRLSDNRTRAEQVRAGDMLGEERWAARLRYRPALHNCGSVERGESGFDDSREDVIAAATSCFLPCVVLPPTVSPLEAEDRRFGGVCRSLTELCCEATEGMEEGWA